MLAGVWLDLGKEGRGRERADLRTGRRWRGSGNLGFRRRDLCLWGRGER